MAPPAPYSGKWGEVALHRDIGDMLANYERQGRLVAWPVPNGALLAGKNMVERARRAKRMKADHQMRPGVWDWHVALPRGRLGVMEVKVGRNDLSEAQDLWGGAVQRLGVLTNIVRSVEQAQLTVMAWLAA